jgi:hypothetical protein
MSSADDIQAMLDDVYGVAGIACRWTPAAGAAVAFTGLQLGGDEVARMRALVGGLNVQARTLKARVSELGVNSVPHEGDAVAFLDGCTPPNVIASFVITGAPRREDPRRLEWTMELANG